MLESLVTIPESQADVSPSEQLEINNGRASPPQGLAICLGEGAEVGIAFILIAIDSVGLHQEADTSNDFELGIERTELPSDIAASPEDAVPPPLKLVRREFSRAAGEGGVEAAAATDAGTLATGATQGLRALATGVHLECLQVKTAARRKVAAAVEHEDEVLRALEAARGHLSNGGEGGGKIGAKGRGEKAEKGRGQDEETHGEGTGPSGGAFDEE